MDHCPAQAIAWNETLHVDFAKCSGCGICAAVCPTGALEATSPTNAELLNRIESRKQAVCVALACPNAVSGADERVIPVSCLGRLDESVLVGAVSWGIEQVLLVDGPCHDCPHAAGRTAVGQAVAESNALVNAFGISPRISFVSQLPRVPVPGGGTCAAGDAMSRRAFFGVLTRESKVVAALTVSSVLDTQNENKVEIKKGELPQRVPVKRQLLLAALRRLGKPVLADFETQNASWATCHVQETCTGCQMCAFFCPTGALSKMQKQGAAGLAFRVSQCTNCRLCQEVCYQKAIDLHGRIDLGKALEDVSDTIVLSLQASALHSSETKLRRLIQSIS